MGCICHSGCASAYHALCYQRSKSPNRLISWLCVWITQINQPNPHLLRGHSRQSAKVHLICTGRAGIISINPRVGYRASPFPPHADVNKSCVAFSMSQLGAENRNGVTAGHMSVMRSCLWSKSGLCCRISPPLTETKTKAYNLVNCCQRLFTDYSYNLIFFYIQHIGLEVLHH